ncbi:PREDICTED: 5'-AMP-activated protein kinase subunit beta-2 isoform X1 [Vollenhovia emeryi]|uniref:5'-AMP-activated protein kinase subunit beta-2 isoform X1 n=2 Tax=Vollenhovia emeryi TaxID=411798 RepID=UPI0005F58D58|nr:PREDICTED: 5'-AMP-activated protein kinase subunit beta-2 isoform X1 [Vollenhovia emeryi]
MRCIQPRSRILRFPSRERPSGRSKHLCGNRVASEFLSRGRARPSFNVASECLHSRFVVDAYIGAPGAIMGNAGSNQPVGHHHGTTVSREHRHSKDHPPPSPGKEGQAFVFDKKPSQKLVFQSSHEEEEPYFAKSGQQDGDDFGSQRPRSNTVSEGTKVADSKVLPTVFKWEGGGKQVYISGTFTGWKTLPMVKSHGDFVTIIDLPEGEHQYKFFVDGEWRHDPGLKIVDNGMGSKNNLVSVRKSDFEVFQALAKDSEGVTSSTQTEYGQEIPPHKPWEKITGPPILPPHLLQVILNKDTPLSCEPTLLPEPNHVMLNHLYALSIKDSVMVLSATHRYRKKYVTTLLYKPI